MRIGLVSYEYPPQRGLGGVGSYTFRLAGALGRAGYPVTVLAGPNEAPDLHQPNVTIHRIPARYDPPLPARSLRWAYWRVFARLMNWSNPIVWHWMRWDFATGTALRAIHRQTPLDVLEAPEHAANGLVAGLYGDWPLIVRIHGPWDLFFGINRSEGTTLNRLLTHLEWMSTQYATTVTTPTRTMARFMEKRWRLARRPTVLANFMDVPRHRPDLPLRGQRQTIVCAGRIERFKGQDVLVKAFAAVAGKHPLAELLLIGPDQWSSRYPFAAVVERLVAEPAVRRRIHLPGPLPLQQVQEELSRAAVAVVPSSGFESFSFSTLEAMAAGRPIVASRAGAIPELLAGGAAGILVQPHQADELAQSLDRLLSDRDLSEGLGVAAYQRARERYDTSVVVPAFVHTYCRARDAWGGFVELPRPEVPALQSA